MAIEHCDGCEGKPICCKESIEEIFRKNKENPRYSLVSDVSQAKIAAKLSGCSSVGTNLD